MQLAAITMLVAFVTLTNSSVNSEPAVSGSTMEPAVEAVVAVEAAVSVEAAVGEAANAVGAAASAVSTAADVVSEGANAGSVAVSLDVLEQPSDVTRPSVASMPEICAELRASAHDHSLPVAFFARLIWQESRFRTDARSPVGARGIAQFMPGTAVWRGLVDPLDPIQSLRKSAHYLRELRDQFGNLGLAAAAYNGGSGRVQKWLDGRGGMPRETRDYVRIVTGSPIEEWRAKANATTEQAGRIPERVPCPIMVAIAASSDPDPEVKKTPVAEPRVAESTRARSGKRGKSSRHAQVASSSKAKARAHRGQRRVKSARVATSKRSVASRRASARGRTAELRIERRAEKL